MPKQFVPDLWFNPRVLNEDQIFLTFLKAYNMPYFGFWAFRGG